MIIIIDIVMGVLGLAALAGFAAIVLGFMADDPNGWTAKWSKKKDEEHEKDGKK